jgi:aryl-alcohol dehydrogenase-like predicted oxidoreductase
MSGGRFNYAQSSIKVIIYEIEEALENQGKLIEEDRIYHLGEPEYYTVYSEAVQAEMKNAIKALQVAYTYAQRLDWFLSDHDNEESFFERLREDLSKI